MLWGTKNFIGRFTTYLLNSNTKKIAFRFTAIQSDTASEIYFYISSINGSPGNIKVGLQLDVNGVPSGTFLTSVTTSPSSGWNSYNITDYVLTSGLVYYIVIEPISGFDASNYITISYGNSQTSGGL